VVAGNQTRRACVPASIAWVRACACLGMAVLIVGGVADRAAGVEPPAPDTARSGWYLGLGGIFAIEDISFNTTQLKMVPPEPPATDPKFDNSGGVDFRAGYRMSPHWALEFDYQWQAGFDSSNPAVKLPGTEGVEIDTHLLSLNAKLFGATGRWQPYGLLGASLLVFNKEIVDLKPKPWDIDYGFAPRFGLGIDYCATEHWVLTLEGTYIVPVGVLDGANMGSVGAGFQYRF
jgi:opacity protein-like surface antigen